MSLFLKWTDIVNELAIDDLFTFWYFVMLDKNTASMPLNQLRGGSSLSNDLGNSTKFIGKGDCPYRPDISMYEGI